MIIRKITGYINIGMDSGKRTKKRLEFNDYFLVPLLFKNQFVLLLVLGVLIHFATTYSYVY